MINDWQPRDGWRVFLGEVGIIVLGVLVALAIGVIAESIRWRLRAGEMRRTILSEMAINGGVYDERALVQPCLDRRLVEVGAVLRQARASGRIPEIGEIGRPPIRPMAIDNWQLASGSEALLYFDPQEVKLLSMHNDTIADNRDQMLSEQEAWATLRAIESSAGPISDNLVSELTLVLSRLRFLSYMNGLEAAQGVEMVRRFGLTPNYFTLFDKEGGKREQVVDLVRKRTVCQPLRIGETPAA